MPFILYSLVQLLLLSKKVDEIAIDSVFDRGSE